MKRSDKKRINKIFGPWLICLLGLTWDPSYLQSKQITQAAPRSLQSQSKALSPRLHKKASRKVIIPSSVIRTVTITDTKASPAIEDSDRQHVSFPDPGDYRKEMNPRFLLDYRLASAALSAYDRLNHVVPGFSSCNHFEEGGFHAQTLCNRELKIVIIAFRGTRTIQDFYYDLAMFYGQESVVGSLGNLYMNLGQLQDRFISTFFSIMLATMTKISNDPLAIKSLERNHLRLQGEISSRWKNYIESNLTPVSVAENILDHRVALVRSYTEKEIVDYHKLGYKVYVTGHSLGGLYAQLASMMFGIPGASFNAPGVSPTFHQCKNFLPEHNYVEDFVNHRHAKDWVSNFHQENHHGDVHLYELEKTDPFTAHNMNALIAFLEDAEFIGLDLLDDAWISDVEETVGK